MKEDAAKDERFQSLLHEVKDLARERESSYVRSNFSTYLRAPGEVVEVEDETEDEEEE